MNTKKKIIFSIIFIAILILLIDYIQYPSGFIFASIYPKKPEILHATIEPIKVEPSDYMEISVKVKDKYGIKSVKADIAGIETIELKLAEGNETEGIYKGYWFVHSVEAGKTYDAKIIVENVKNQESYLVLQFHDDPTFPYRIPIIINNTGNSNTLTDYQVNITLNTASLISQGKMRSDCGDIRFNDNKAFDTALWSNNLSYWILEGCNSTETKIWVKVSSIPANSNNTIYVYYGIPSLTSLSNGNNTFIYFNLMFDGPIGGRTSHGGPHTCALLSDGTAKCWGRNNYGQLGDGTTDTKYAPSNVLNYNLDGRYDKSNGIYTVHRPPYFSENYFVRPYVSQEPSSTVGQELNIFIIYKGNAYGIGANATHAFSMINNEFVSAPISSGWNFITMTGEYIAGSMLQKLYVNGVLHSIQSVPGTIQTNSNPLTIFIPGVADEIKIYNRALSQDEIRAHYERRKYSSTAITYSIGNEQTR